MKNISVKLKLLILTVPLILCIIILVIFAGREIQTTSDKVSEVYYDTLFQTSSLLINADRDLYQAYVPVVEIMLARDYIPDSAFQDLVKDYDENCQQVYDRMAKADAIASQVPSLYNEALAGTSDSFSSLMKKTKAEMDTWTGMINLQTGGGEDFEAASAQFSNVRDPLGEMGDIVEQWATEEHAVMEKENTRTIIISAVIFGIISVLLLLLAIYIMLLITSCLKEATEKINQLADGDLKVEFDESRVGNDEVGEIYKSAAKLASKLGSIISQTKQMSGNLKV
ncbi:MAG: methyl-accepting chemotaxis protein, partial [Lachnospiraceae bacterium]|nr:methyl-accepting chemotaxis protein [Lachnospiraceae bacterium]